MAENVTIPRKHQRLLQLIECPVCLNELQDPRMLSCRHTLCYTCVKDYTEKNKYDKELHCPVCREVNSLYEGGVDNLPKYFFINEIKEVAAEEDGVNKATLPHKPRCVFCSTEDCGEVAVSFCTKGCEYLCQLCDDEHRTSRRTKSHNVVTVSEGEELIKSSVPTYPPCQRHKHQLLDLYCRTCNIPMCTTCCQVNHKGHDSIEIDEQSTLCKTKLEQIRKDTDQLIGQVKQAINKTKCQALHAETDIDHVCDNVKSTFKKMHDKLDIDEQNMLSELQEARKRTKKMVDVIADSQVMTLSCLHSLKSCHIMLEGKDSPYDFVTATDSIQRHLERNIKEFPGLLWSSDIINKRQGGEVSQARVHMKQSMFVPKKQSEVGRISLHYQDKEGVLGLVVFKTRVYVAHFASLDVYCYDADGSLREKYEHEHDEGEIEKDFRNMFKNDRVEVQGMCLMMNDNKAMIVLSVFTSLIWIEIKDDFTMKHHHTQHVWYCPHGSCDDRGELLVCAAELHRIYRYTSDGQELSVITMPNDVKPLRVTRHGDGNHYFVTDGVNNQVVMIDREGNVKTRYKNTIHDVKLGVPYALTTNTVKLGGTYEYNYR